jgi:hypothetical protein
MNPRSDWSWAEVEPDSATLTVPVLDADGFVRSEFQRLAQRRNEEARNDPWLQIQWMGFREDSIVVRQIEAGSEDAVRTTLEEMLRSATEAAHRERKKHGEKEAASAREAEQRAEKAAGMQDRFRSFDSE